MVPRINCMEVNTTQLSSISGPEARTYSPVPTKLFPNTNWRKLETLIYISHKKSAGGKIAGTLAENFMPVALYSLCTKDRLEKRSCFYSPENMFNSWKRRKTESEVVVLFLSLHCKKEKILDKSVDACGFMWSCSVARCSIRSNADVDSLEWGFASHISKNMRLVL